LIRIFWNIPEYSEGHGYMDNLQTTRHLQLPFLFRSTYLPLPLKF
jgi:hypothetical protein